jgi:hypothetical protein
MAKHVMRTAAKLSTGNVFVFRKVPLRFQITPGTQEGVGIAGLDYTITLDGKIVGTGTTDADGEVEVPLDALIQGSPVLRILDTDYHLHLHPGLQPLDTLAGQQKRLDHLGYMTGYLTEPIGSAVPDDGVDSPRTQQAIMNFQMDREAVAIHGDMSSETIADLYFEMGGD